MDKPAKAFHRSERWMPRVAFGREPFWSAGSIGAGWEVRDAFAARWRSWRVRAIPRGPLLSYCQLDDLPTGGLPKDDGDSKGGRQLCIELAAEAVPSQWGVCCLLAPWRH